MLGFLPLPFDAVVWTMNPIAANLVNCLSSLHFTQDTSIFEAYAKKVIAIAVATPSDTAHAVILSGSTC